MKMEGKCKENAIKWKEMAPSGPGCRVKKKPQSGTDFVSYFLIRRPWTGGPKMEENKREIQRKCNKMEGEWLPPALAPN